MFKSLVKLLLAATLAVSSASAYYQKVSLSAKAKNKVVGVRVSDVISYLGNIVPSLYEVNKEILDNPENYIKGGKIQEVHNLYFDAIPRKSGNNVLLDLRAMVRYKNGGVQFQTMQVRYNTATPKNLYVTGNLYSIDETDFEFETSLVSRKLIAYDRANNTKMIFPLGVGSFDEGVLSGQTSLLTPRFKTAWLDKRVNMYSRKKPRYFKKKPFIRILTSQNVADGWTGIGFHAQPNLDKFVRAFDSHGCMRMELQDLYLLYHLVDKGPRQSLPITVNYRTSDLSDHPFPKQNKPYQRVVNGGNKSNPKWILDRDDLIMVSKNWKSEAPVNELVDYAADHYNEMINYSIAELRDERREEKKDACSEQHLDDLDRDDFLSDRDYEKAYKKAKKAYDKCMKKGKKKKTIRDRLYKWWVHG
ncbi:L,D-transpeptidase [Halobacteriovorax sp. GB3]|uniref:L,D-transpeptidase n=1 Tax=Halobacteriovorax sp. GB3 TaxID=2719615 RepID=UPI002362AA91|nr:L,D-transpeptidase [Halobacteriovorax sp. GB3]MDD0852719.1 L,D-transpeptidase [Halobacteriovorax sp. GB3]